MTERKTSRVGGFVRAGRCCVAAGLLLGAGMASAATYRLDPDNSFVHFEIRHFGTSTIRGRFGPLAGGVTMDPAAGTGEVGITIETRLVDTGMAPFNARLRQADILSVEAYPQAWFVARQFRFEGDRLAEVRGEFTLRGTSRPLSLVAQRFGCRQDDERKREVCGGDFVGEFDRSQFGIDFGLPFIGGTVRLVVQVEALRD